MYHNLPLKQRIQQHPDVVKEQRLTLLLEGPLGWRFS